MNKRIGVSTKVLVLMMTFVLVIGATIGGTLAWLSAKTETITNTFEAAGIKIELTETEGLNDDGVWKNAMVPGATYDKNPTVTVVEPDTSVDCYLFVKFEANEAAKSYLTYTSLLEDEDSGWIKLTGVDNVWYREVLVDDEIKSWELLGDNKVTVKDTVTADNMSEAATAELKYTSYAVQVLGSENAAEAWGKISQ